MASTNDRGPTGEGAARQRLKDWLLQVKGSSRRSLVIWIAVAAIVGLVGDQVARIGDFRVDDAYITFSFSKNVAEGHGPVYSHQLRVEGYSNFLWMLSIAAGYVLAPSVDVYLVARLLAFAWLGLGLYIVYRLARHKAGPTTALVAPILLVICSDVIRATLSGLETVPFAVAIAFGWLVYLREPADRRRWSLLAFLPAALLRIDGFVPLLIVVGFEGLSSLVERRFSLRTLARWALPALGIWALYFVWRYAYYGLPLPTTYYAKSLVTLNEPARGYDQAWSFLREYGALPLLFLMAVPALRNQRRDVLALWTAIVLYVVYTGMAGGDWMPFRRFLLPVVPLAAVLCAWGLAALIEELRRLPAMERSGGFALVAMALGFFAVHAHMAVVVTPPEGRKLKAAAHVQVHTEGLLQGMDLARWVLRVPGERLVTDYAGVFAVFTQAHVIDMWGLCNELIARHGGANGINPIYGKECAQCFAKLAPDYFHANVPLVRHATSFQDHEQVLQSVFQGEAIDRVIDLRANFAVGRVLEISSGRAFWFLERRRADWPLRTREPTEGIRVDYPFEPA